MCTPYSKNVRSIAGVFCLVGLMLSGCAARSVEVSPPLRSIPESEIPESEPTQALTRETKEPVEPDPRALASLKLTEQARLSLESRKPGEAIRILERAVNLDPANGRNYYFLAEAWLMKGVVGQAREFNRLAEIYIAREDASWRKRVERQGERIDRTY